MDKLGTQLRKYARVSLAGFMSVWLSGVIFLLCCDKINGRSSEPEFCPMAKMSGHCHKAKRQNADSHFVETAPQDCVDCCGFLPAIFDKNRKVERDQKQATRIEKVVAVQVKQPVVKNLAVTPRAVYTRVSLQKKSFIKNCVFRI